MGGVHTGLATNHNPGLFGYIGVFSAGFGVGRSDLDEVSDEGEGRRREALLGWRRDHRFRA